MQHWQTSWDGSTKPSLADAGEAQLVLAHGPRAALTESSISAIQAACPKADVVACSGAGEIMDTIVSDDKIVITAIRFDKASVEVHAIQLEDGEDSTVAGKRLVAGLDKEGLRHVMVISDGLHVNGTALVEGMVAGLPPNVAITGGLAGDGADFGQTVVAANGPALEKQIAAIGFYGDIQVGYGSLGGWDAFGPERVITRAKDNVLYELDGQPALDLYKSYLGEHADGLPGTGLLFPLYLPNADKEGVVRTILAVDEKEQSMTFAGDLPQGATAQLMMANFDRLVDGAQSAAERSSLKGGAELAILISCVGRKLVLKQRVEDELDAVREVLGPDACMAGFYSYGEICPSAVDADCKLHNQTMTITTFREG